MDLATSVKLELYDRIAQTTLVPLARDVAEQLAAPLDSVRRAFEELQRQRLLVLDARGEIRMAPPFSAVPTAHQALVGDLTYQANCVWDAFGVVAALGGNGVAITKAGGSGAELRFPIHDGIPDNVAAVFHYAVPAAKWWQDIVFT